MMKDGSKSTITRSGFRSADATNTNLNVWLVRERKRERERERKRKLDLLQYIESKCGLMR